MRGGRKLYRFFFERQSVRIGWNDYVKIVLGHRDIGGSTFVYISLTKDKDEIRQRHNDKNSIRGFLQSDIVFDLTFWRPLDELDNAPSGKLSLQSCLWSSLSLLNLGYYFYDTLRENLPFYDSVIDLRSKTREYGEQCFLLSSRTSLKSPLF